MTSISSAVASYSSVASAPVSAPAADDSSTQQSAPASAPVADSPAPSDTDTGSTSSAVIYNALASASASNIRGTSVDTSA